MFHSRNMENRIKGIHERTLRSVYDDSRNSSFEELLVKDKTQMQAKIVRSVRRSVRCVKEHIHRLAFFWLHS